MERKGVMDEAIAKMKSGTHRVACESNLYCRAHKGNLQLKFSKGKPLNLCEKLIDWQQMMKMLRLQSFFAWCCGQRAPQLPVWEQVTTSLQDQRAHQNWDQSAVNSRKVPLCGNERSWENGEVTALRAAALPRKREHPRGDGPVLYQAFWKGESRLVKKK